MLANGKQLLFLILHPSCYLYNQGVFETTIRKQTQLTILHTIFRHDKFDFPLHSHQTVCCNISVISRRVINRVE